MVLPSAPQMRLSHSQMHVRSGTFRSSITVPASTPVLVKMSLVKVSFRASRERMMWLPLFAAQVVQPEISIASPALKSSSKPGYLCSAAVCSR